MRLIPSTEALRALESFARHGTVWRVADELNLTRSAVSHRLRQLERDLGFRLFDRVGTRNELTPQALRYVADVRTALTTLAGSADRHGGDGPAVGQLTVSCAPGLASVWLCHRLTGFRETHPEIDLTVTVPQSNNVCEAGPDLFIAFGSGPWPGHHSERLLDVELTALCSPTVLNGIGRTGFAADVTGACLLHLRDHAKWMRWFEAAGLDPDQARTGVILSEITLVFSAMLAGQGMAIADPFVCERMLQSGALVRPYDVTIRIPRGYHLVLPTRSARLPQAQAFAEWLRGEVGQRSETVQRLLGPHASEVGLVGPRPKLRNQAVKPARWGEQHIGPTIASVVVGK